MCIMPIFLFLKKEICENLSQKRKFIGSKVKGFGGADTECPSSSSFLFIGKGYVELRGRRSFFVHFQAVPFPKAHILLSLSMVSII